MNIRPTNVRVLTAAQVKEEMDLMENGVWPGPEMTYSIGLTALAAMRPDEPDNFDRLCNQCDHFIDLRPGESSPTCAAAKFRSVVTGETSETPWFPCWRMRENGAPCGPGGRLYEERPA
jgi:hypothetical protein